MAWDKARIPRYPLKSKPHQNQLQLRRNAANGHSEKSSQTPDKLPENTMATLASKFRGATVEDLDPPPALSLHPSDPLSHALLCAFERDYTHLTIVSGETRALLGYLSIPRLKQLLKDGVVKESDPIDKAMNKFRRKGKAYKIITMDTPLEELEAFFDGKWSNGEKQDFAVVTDYTRRFVLGVATRGDLEEFVKRRPG
jgi:CBS domain-containing protein